MKDAESYSKVFSKVPYVYNTAHLPISKGKPRVVEFLKCVGLTPNVGTYWTLVCLGCGSIIIDNHNITNTYMKCPECGILIDNNSTTHLLNIYYEVFPETKAAIEKAAIFSINSQTPDLSYEATDFHEKHGRPASYTDLKASND